MASVGEAQEILKALGMPAAQYNQMAGMTLIALCGLTPDSAWEKAERRRCTVTKGIMDYLAEHYETTYAANTRETFRRQVLHQFVQAGLSEYNPLNPTCQRTVPMPTMPSRSSRWMSFGVMEPATGTPPWTASDASEARSRSATPKSGNDTWSP